MKWNLDEGIAFCKMLENHLYHHGYHVALGGSVLINGKSEKDLDIFIYPHHKNENNNIQNIRNLFRDIGLICIEDKEKVQNRHLFDTKHVEIWEWKNKRVDIFFVN